MKEIERHRIKFYSKEDMSVGHFLVDAEKILDNSEQVPIIELNDLIEYYNIKVYFDNKLFLNRWNHKMKSKYIDKVECAFKKLKENILSLNDETLQTELSNLDYNYFGDFWKLINDLGAYKNITAKTFTDLLQSNQRQIYYVLEQKKLIEKYDKEIRIFLMAYERSAEIILSILEEKNILKTKDLKFLPKSLSLEDKDRIINDYLNNEEPNLNYVRLIENSKDTTDFKLKAKTRLKARRKSEELNNKILAGSNSWKVGVSISFDKDQEETVKYNSEGTDLQVTYSEKFIDQFNDNINLFGIFKYLFFFTDSKSLITLVSKQSELDVFESMSMKSKNEYEIGVAFHRKENLAFLQLHIFEHYLQRKGKSIESLINSYVDLVNEKINPHKLIFKIGKSETTYLEKIRIIAPDFEFLLKQFKTLVEENSIDLELIQISSTPVRFSEIYSLKQKKYLYSNDNLIMQLKYLFYSDQSHLFYVKPFENKYDNLYNLLTNENVKIEYFENYQRETIVSLVKDGYLKVNNQGYIILHKEVFIYLVGEIHRHEVLSYWNYPKEIRVVLDELLNKNLLITENTLFTRQEKNYLNYYLNKKEFTNGFDLRNKYLHGTNTFSENEHKNDYYKLIKLIILTLLKIEDDITEK